ncbi:unnamed protein product [Trifolium pratense]|uniref:Uncharacterized protein n=1 Tax=Trifolium pratense TaxID=57577 RepID=A0ACB0KZA5_TRIPR|nr:unnamed protein product [Trifolium pratense]
MFSNTLGLLIMKGVHEFNTQWYNFYMHNLEELNKCLEFKASFFEYLIWKVSGDPHRTKTG